jgi:hypothetical protein
MRAKSKGGELAAVLPSGYKFHRSRYAWERDRRREREARARGDDFRRFTFGDVEQPRAMLAELSVALS